MKELRMTLINTEHFNRCVTILQGSLGCMVIKKADEILFYTFNEMDDYLIIKTLEDETGSQLIECKTPEELL